MTKEAALQAILERPTVTPEVVHASGVLPISRNSIYEACKPGGAIQCFRAGKRIIIPTAPLRRKLGIGC
jgi:hypothetical protein